MTIPSVNLSGDHADPPATEARSALSRNTHDAVAALSAEVAALQLHQDNLQRAMATRAVIEQAKGVLMQRYGVTADTAFAILVRWSRTANVKLHTVAEVLLAVAAEAETQTEKCQLARWLTEQLQSPIARELNGPDP